jgi:NAD(P)-dependent dehydrogenase (short-subunit alcohol dehydrogenase family)
MVERFTGGSSEAETQLVAQEPIGRMGTPEEIADAVIWLCSGGAGFGTGHSLVVDGGFVAR